MAGFCGSVWSIPLCNAEHEHVSRWLGAENCVWERITCHQNWQVVGELGESFPGRLQASWGGKGFGYLQGTQGLALQPLTQRCTGSSFSLGKQNLCLALMLQADSGVVNLPVNEDAGCFDSSCCKLMEVPCFYQQTTLSSKKQFL